MTGPRIGVLGVASDATVVHFGAQARLRGAEIVAIDIYNAATSGDWVLSVPANSDDWIDTGTSLVAMGDLQAVFARLIDVSEPEDEQAGRWRGLMSGLTQWLATASIPVINRPGHHEHNSSKPLHEAWLTRNGLLVPESLVTQSREQLVDFSGGLPLVVKSISGVRSHARLATLEEIAAYDPLDGPVHVQRHISGDDLRVHVIGGECFATRFSSSAVDYRRDGARREWYTSIPWRLADDLVRLTQEQGLDLAGWDFKVDESERYWCLEVNPMPAYELYDDIANGEISSGLVRRLLSAAAPAGSIATELDEEEDEECMKSSY